MGCQDDTQVELHVKVEIAAAPKIVSLRSNGGAAHFESLAPRSCYTVLAACDAWYSGFSVYDDITHINALQHPHQNKHWAMLFPCRIRNITRTQPRNNVHCEMSTL